MSHSFDATAIKDLIPAGDFYLREQGLVRLGTGQWTVAGLCPFHDDRSSGSFFVHLETGAFKCFSCGAKGGDIIAFVTQKYGLSFNEALARLAAEEGTV